jgi:ABC-type transport system involved in Fe-S cluster assembly fused permease/ATPase subunit
LLYTSILLFLFSCKNTEKQNLVPADVDTEESIQIQDYQPDSFSGDVPSKIEVELDTKKNYFEVKHKSDDQEKIDSIKAKKNKQKTGKY